MKIKEGDFISLDYTGTVDGKIFDVTDEAIAKKENIYRENMKYGSVIIIVGSQQLIKGLDKALVGKEPGQEFEIEVNPEDAFGKKNPKLLKIMSANVFREQKINPAPGMQINIDGILGCILSASGGRVVVDFNHPLSGKVLKYKVKIHKKIDDQKEQVNSVLELYTGLAKDKFKVEITGKNVKISCSAEKPLPDKVKEVLEKDLQKYIGLEKVEISNKSEKENNK